MLTDLIRINQFQRILYQIKYLFILAISLSPVILLNLLVTLQAICPRCKDLDIVEHCIHHYPVTAIKNTASLVVSVLTFALLDDQLLPKVYFIVFFHPSKCWYNNKTFLSFCNAEFSCIITGMLRYRKSFPAKFSVAPWQTFQISFWILYSISVEECMVFKIDFDILVFWMWDSFFSIFVNRIKVCQFLIDVRGKSFTSKNINLIFLWMKTTYNRDIFKLLGSNIGLTIFSPEIWDLKNTISLGVHLP